jgi:hypothetical protein
MGELSWLQSHWSEIAAVTAGLAVFVLFLKKIGTFEPARDDLSDAEIDAVVRTWEHKNRFLRIATQTEGNAYNSIKKRRCMTSKHAPFSLPPHWRDFMGDINCMIL